MATVGHTLVGLSLGSAWRARLPGKVLPAIWIGFVVLCAHLIDIMEWVLVLIDPARFTTHTLTHAPLLIALVYAAVGLLMAVVFRVRTVLPYLIVAAALTSHLIMDHLSVRRWLSELYAGSALDELPPLEAAIEAEFWLYGFLVVLALLVRAAMDHACPMLGRRAAVWLALVATIALLTRLPAVWIPGYLLGALHGVLMIRKELHPKMLWGLVPLVPLAILVAVELWAGRIHKEALALQKREEYAAAAKLHHRALAAPKRSSRTMSYIYLSICQRELGDWNGAERSLRQAVATAESPYNPLLTLARLLSHPRVRDTDFYRPEEALQIARDVLADPNARKYHPGAQRVLDLLTP